MEVESVFIDLRLSPTSLESISSQLLPTQILPDSGSIWGFLNRPEEAFRRLAIVGPPGSGKTTLLQHLVLTLVNTPRRFHHLIPIHIRLREHKETIWTATSRLTLADLATSQCVQSRVVPPPTWFADQLESGNCLVLLDGLDEIADPRRRQKVAQWVNTQIETFFQNRFIITSRPHGYKSNPVQRVMLLSVQPLVLDQIEQLVNKWYLGNAILRARTLDSGIREDAAAKANRLMRVLRTNTAISRLAVNPLLLTMITIVHSQRPYLPERRVELYAQICDVFLGGWQTAKDLSEKLSAPQRLTILQPLALEMMIRGISTIPANEAATIIESPLAKIARNKPISPTAFLKDIEDSSWLLHESEAGEYSFAHLTFQEYLASVHLVATHQDTFLFKHLATSWWHETIRLYAAQVDATELIRECAKLAFMSHGVKESKDYEIISLANDCINERLSADPDAGLELIQLLTNGFVALDESQRHRSAGALLALRLRNMLRLSDERQIDLTYISCAEYQLFLDDLPRGETQHHPDHWGRRFFSSDDALSPIAGIRREDAFAFCVWLTQWARERGDPVCRYRLPTVEEATQVEVPSEGRDDLFVTLRSSSVGTWCEGGQPSIVGVAEKQRSEWKDLIFRYALEEKEAFGVALTRSRRETAAIQACMESDDETRRRIERAVLEGSYTFLKDVRSQCYALAGAAVPLAEALKSLAMNYEMATNAVFGKVMDDDWYWREDIAMDLLNALNVVSSDALLHSLGVRRPRAGLGKQWLLAPASGPQRILFEESVLASIQQDFGWLKSWRRDGWLNKLAGARLTIKRLLWELGSSLVERSFVAPIVQLPGFFLYLALAQNAVTNVSSNSWRRRVATDLQLQRMQMRPGTVEEGDERQVYFESFFAMCMLNMRLSGRLPAWESIRIVQERII